ncbi:ABC transporter ATP-binding protein [Coraliomargarita sp. SDUM461004]|uniref:ABC transporter ATP-binding protein n=1 Tax=Thalassobacterium sedimentorum TaxID=3041258 RepID=A0ABU1ADR6_9BACT|nr:ABC transporter ATP-binding protein [Coraliomargarita sp. SDUM461004]MDQ8192795.1 ABC transporter ATP-binding protein [Coraliomargarita sp. SDUM461004]
MSDSAHSNCECQAHAGEPVVCFEGVSFSYGHNLIIDDADFDIYQGESVCVIGPNGGGKSTLLKLMLGLLVPDRGEIRLFGEPAQLGRTRVGYVPQQIEFDPLFPVSALDVALMGRLSRGSFGFVSKSDRAMAQDALAKMGLADQAKAPFASLSGGQRQAVLIARALVAQTELLLLDEPTAHVDVAAEERLMYSLKKLGGELTVITVSHDLAFVSRSVPKVVCVNRCVHVHPTAKLTEARIREIYGHEVRMVQHDHEHLDSHGGHHHG